jgi:hypothetical protein
MKHWIKTTLTQAAWAPLVVFLVYGVGAKIFDVYLTFPNLDIPTHFLGGAAMAYFFLAAIEHSQHLLGAIPRAIQALLAIGLSTWVAVVWEFLEYGSDLLLRTQMNLGVRDTLSDLFFGVLGAFVVAGLAYRRPGYAKLQSGSAGG